MIDKGESCEVATGDGSVTILDSGGVGTFITITATETSGDLVVVETLIVEVKNPGRAKETEEDDSGD